MKFIKKLDSHGLAHFLMPLVVVVGIAVIGTFMLVASHADSPTVTTAKATKVKTGSIKIKAVYCGKPLGVDSSGEATCKGSIKTSKADISVAMLLPDAKGRCNATVINGLTAVSFGTVRKLKCTPGDYTVSVANGKTVSLLNKAGKVVKVLNGSEPFTIQSGRVAMPQNLYAAP